MGKYEEKSVATGQDGDKGKTEQIYSTPQPSKCQADQLLDMIDPIFADDTKSWWEILSAYRNSGGSLERAVEWSYTPKYNEPRQVERAWNNSKSKAGIGTLIHFAKKSGHSNVVAQLPQKPAIDTEKAKKVLIDPWANLGTAALEAELLQRSNPKPCGTSGPDDLLLVLGMCKNEDTLVYPQNTYDTGSYSRDTVAGWRKRLLSGEAPREFIIPNVHCGEMRQTQDGKPSWRADACFTRRFVVTEFDEMTLDDQLRLWLSLIDFGVRPALLTFSGSRSVHAWLPAKTTDEVDRIFDLLIPLGADPHTRNVGRLSRTPGAVRKDKATVQRLLYLNYEVSS
jgi:hypothetical protein